MQDFGQLLDGIYSGYTIAPLKLGCGPPMHANGKRERRTSHVRCRTRVSELESKAKVQRIFATANHGTR